jgi:two-component system chemotaxis response regulator CheB
METSKSDFDGLESLGKSSPFICPNCGGELTHIEGNQVDQYRCLTGHTYTNESLSLEKLESLEQLLWVVIRRMEERKNLLIMSISGNKEVGGTERSKQVELHIGHLKEMLLNIDV